jgi:flagellin
MSMSINTNLYSMTSQDALQQTQLSLQTSMERLSTGLRINSAADDAAGLAISQRMQAQVNGMNVAVQNANNGISLAQTADSALASVGDSLQRMRELAVEARNSTNSSSDQDSLNQEFQALGAEVARVIGGTTFNGTAILAGGAGTLEFQVGANVTSNDAIAVGTANLSTDSTIMAIENAGGSGSIGSTVSFASLGSVVTALDSAINDINSQRATFGATENRFNAVVSNLQSAVVNQSAAEGRITDANFAQETANLSRAQILQQAGTAMVAQANQLPQGVLKLLQ